MTIHGMTMHGMTIHGMNMHRMTMQGLVLSCVGGVVELAVFGLVRDLIRVVVFFAVLALSNHSFFFPHLSILVVCSLVGGFFLQCCAHSSVSGKNFPGDGELSLALSISAD